MQILLNQREIETALVEYIGSQGITISGKHIEVTLTAGRAPNGMSATVDISEVKVEVGDKKELASGIQTPVVAGNAAPAAGGNVFGEHVEEATQVTGTETAAEEKPLFGN